MQPRRVGVSQGMLWSSGKTQLNCRTARGSRYESRRQAQRAPIPPNHLFAIRGLVATRRMAAHRWPLIVCVSTCRVPFSWRTC